jgi:hypothetical protein
VVAISWVQPSLNRTSEKLAMPRPVVSRSSQHQNRGWNGSRWGLTRKWALLGITVFRKARASRSWASITAMGVWSSITVPQCTGLHEVSEFSQHQCPIFSMTQRNNVLSQRDRPVAPTQRPGLADAVCAEWSIPVPLTGRILCRAMSGGVVSRRRHDAHCAKPYLRLRSRDDQLEAHTSVRRRRQFG